MKLWSSPAVVAIGGRTHQASLSDRAIRFDDIAAVCDYKLCLLISFKILLDLIADEDERLDLSERDEWRASAWCAWL